MTERSTTERARAVLLLGLTWFSTAATHLTLWSRLPVGAHSVGRSALFATALLAILIAHEAGHRWAASRRGIRVTMPMFLPAPLLFGTFGAVIGLRSGPRDRAGLLEMALAGPAAGLCAVGVELFARQILGAPTPAPGIAPVDLALPPGWRVAAAAGFAPAEVDPSDPLTFACWIAVWITGANLLPFGQLDGGHILGAVLPAWGRTATLAVTAGLGVAGFWWAGWWIWLAVLWLLGASTPLEPERPGSLSVTARWMAGLAAVACLGSLSLVPFS